MLVAIVRRFDPRCVPVFLKALLLNKGSVKSGIGSWEEAPKNRPTTSLTRVDRIPGGVGSSLNVLVKMCLSG